MVLHENVKEFPDERMTDNLGLVRVGVCLYVDGNYSHQHTPGCSGKGMTFGNLNVYSFYNIMDLTPLSLRGTEFKLLLKALLDPTESGFPVSRTRKYLLYSRVSKNIKILWTVV